MFCPFMVVDSDFVSETGMWTRIAATGREVGDVRLEVSRDESVREKTACASGKAKTIATGRLGQEEAGCC